VADHNAEPGWTWNMPGCGVALRQTVNATTTQGRFTVYAFAACGFAPCHFNLVVEQCSLSWPTAPFESAKPPPRLPAIEPSPLRERSKRDLSP
jgi:hypothetical protein